jgi:hypothetical protein
MRFVLLWEFSYPSTIVTAQRTSHARLVPSVSTSTNEHCQEEDNGRMISE